MKANKQAQAIILQIRAQMKAYTKISKSKKFRGVKETYADYEKVLSEILHVIKNELDIEM